MQTVKKISNVVSLTHNTGSKINQNLFSGLITWKSKPEEEKGKGISGRIREVAKEE